MELGGTAAASAAVRGSRSSLGSTGVHGVTAAGGGPGARVIWSEEPESRVAQRQSTAPPVPSPPRAGMMLAAPGCCDGLAARHLAEHFRQLVPGPRRGHRATSTRRSSRRSPSFRLSLSVRRRRPLSPSSQLAFPRPPPFVACLSSVFCGCPLLTACSL